MENQRIYSAARWFWSAPHCHDRCVLGYPILSLVLLGSRSSIFLLRVRDISRFNLWWNAILVGNQLYTVHELSNTLTQQTIPDTPGSDFPTLTANLSTVPAGVPSGSSYGSAELLLQPLASCASTSPGSQRYLYASNRNVSPNTSLYDPLGDTIAIFATTPKLSLVAQVHTGLDQIRGLTLSKDGKYIAAAGLVGGGLAIYEVTNGGAGLELRARYTGNGSTQVSSFLWL